RLDRRSFPTRRSSDLLWVGCGLVFALRFWNGLAEYHPTYFPTIPLGFDLRSVLADPPFVYALDQLYQARIYFIAIGVTYFLSSSDRKSTRLNSSHVKI